MYWQYLSFSDSAWNLQRFGEDHGYHIGDGPDERAVRTAHTKGTDLSTLRARKLEQSDFHTFDMIIAMDKGHMEIMRAIEPDRGTASLNMFLEFAPDHGIEDVPDPYYGSIQDFEYVYELCLDASLGLLDFTKEELA
jgi:protein-tyrosine phosphatase